MESEIFTEVSAFELKLGLPKGFYSNLLREDDWSFVVKLNALIEAAGTHALVANLKSPVLEDPLSRLQMGNIKSGKIAFLNKLEVLAPDQLKLLSIFGELRNRLVHNVANVSFKMPDYLASVDESKRRELIKYFGIGINDEVKIGERSIPRDRFVAENPKLSLWLTMAEVIACMHLELRTAHLEPAGSGLQDLINVTSDSVAREPKK